MAKLSVFDPPMCCSTGVCGPDGDDELAQFASTLDWVQRSGIDVERFNLGHQPGEFATNALVKGLLVSDGVECLPLVIVDGEVLAKGGYPARAIIGKRLGLDVVDNAGGTDAPADASSASASGASASNTNTSDGCCAPEDASPAKSGCC